MRLSDIQLAVDVCRHRKGVFKDRKLMFYCDLAPDELFLFEEVIFVCTSFCPLKL